MGSPRSAGPFAIGPQPQHTGGTIAPATGSPRHSRVQPSPQPWPGHEEAISLDRLSMRSDRSRIRTPLNTRQDATHGPAAPIAVPRTDSHGRFDGTYSPPVNEGPLSSQSGSASSSMHSVVIYDDPSLAYGSRQAWPLQEDPLLQPMERDSESPPVPLATSQSSVSFVAASVGSRRHHTVVQRPNASVAIVAADLDETSMV